MRVLKAFDDTNVGIECVFRYWPGVVKRTNAKKRRIIAKTSDGSDSDDDVADPSQRKKAKTSNPTDATDSFDHALTQLNKT